MLTRKNLIVLSFALLIVLSEQVISQTSQKERPEYPTGSESQSQQPTNQNVNQMPQIFEQPRIEFQRNGSLRNRMPRVNPEERIMQMQKIAQEQEELAMRQALGVDDRQWKLIKPKIDKIKYYKEQVSVNIGLPFSSTFSSSSTSTGGQSFSGGFQTSFSSGVGGSPIPNLNPANPKLTKGERICQELQVLLDSTSVPGQTQTSQKSIQDKIKELQQARTEAKKQLEKAQEDLKKGLNLHQQARLILMGLLD